MAIPSKQLHRVGTTTDLQTYLSNREIGYSTTDNKAYIKLDGELKSVGGLDADVPANTCVLAGDDTGSYGWYNGVAPAPYDSNVNLWATIKDVGFYAKAAELDSEGRFISSASYLSPRVPTTYGAIQIENVEVSRYKMVSIRKGNSTEYINIGGLMPLKDDNTAVGDVLSITSMSGNQPEVRWVHLDTTPTKSSALPITSGAVYNLQYWIDPNLGASSTGYEIQPPTQKYDVGKYYIVDNAMYLCTGYTTELAEFSGTTVVDALNNAQRSIRVINYANSPSSVFAIIDSGAVDTYLNTRLSYKGEIFYPMYCRIPDGGTARVLRYFQCKYGITRCFSGSETDSAWTFEEFDASTAIAGKQDVLTFDTTPVKDSKNPITSGGVYTLQYWIDPNLHTTTDSLQVENPGKTYTVGKCYILDNDLYTCSYSSTEEADFDKTTIVDVLNNKQTAIKVYTYTNDTPSIIFRDIDSGVVDSYLNTRLMYGSEILYPTYCGTPYKQSRTLVYVNNTEAYFKRITGNISDNTWNYYASSMSSKQNALTAGAGITIKDTNEIASTLVPLTATETLTVDDSAKSAGSASTTITKSMGLFSGFIVVENLVCSNTTESSAVYFEVSNGSTSVGSYYYSVGSCANTISIPFVGSNITSITIKMYTSGILQNGNYTIRLSGIGYESK